MRYIHHKSFGYPVLRSNSENASDWDYPNIAFEPDISLEQPIENDEKKGVYKLSYTFSVNEKSMKKNIKAGNAAYVIKLYCRDTFYGHTEVLEGQDEVEGFIEIDANSIIDELTITTFIVAKNQFKLESDSFHEDYKDESFDISPGFVLAYPEPTVYYTGKDMYKNITSIFTLAKDEELKDGELRCDLTGEKIVLTGTTKQTEQIQIWGKSKNELPEVARAAVFYPVLIYAISKIKDLEEREDFESLKWCKIILAKCTERDIDIDNEDSYQIAQKLANLPLRELSKKFKNQD